MKCQHIPNKQSDVAIVFLHGWCCHHDDFKAQVDFFKNQFAIILPDYTDFILEKVELGEIINFTDCIDQVAECIQSFEYSKLIIIGHSMGGAIALSLALKFHSQLCALFILDTTISSDISNDTQVFLDKITKHEGEQNFLKTMKKLFVSEKYDNLILMNQKIVSMCEVWKKAPKVFSNLLYQAILVDKVQQLKALEIAALYLTSVATTYRADIVKAASEKIKIEYLSSGHFLMLNASDELNQLIYNKIYYNSIR
ncbi:alpha/beta hydrolase [Thiotrichales bacterium 19S3-7]|nr:alpha/beta hydrolase [Thiotrichales bacterium 19S3-7]MCF6802764.1 alpha/beta hydrolase [Thiotrichales bacterium 19S3-11]